MKDKIKVALVQPCKTDTIEIATAPANGQHTPDCCSLVPESFCRECEPLARRLINENRRLLFGRAALLEALREVMRCFVGERNSQNCLGEAGRVADQARAALDQAEGRVS